MLCLAHVLKPLGIVNFRRLMMAISLGIAGDSFWLVGSTWTVIRNEGGVGGTATIAGAGGVGVVISALFGASILTYLDALRVIRVVAIFKVPLTVLGIVLVATGVSPLPVLTSVAFIDGALTGLLVPAVNVLFARYVDPGLLVAANGIENAARPLLAQAVVPLLGAGLVIAFGPTGCLLAAIPALAGGAFFAVRISSGGEEKRNIDKPLRVFEAISQGIRQVQSSKRLSFGMLGSLAVVFAVSGPMSVVLPVALFELSGLEGAVLFGAITTAFGIAAAVGSIAVAPVNVQALDGGWLVAIWAVACLPLCLVGMTRSFGVWLVSAGLVGLVMGAMLSVWAATIQHTVPESRLPGVSGLELFLESLIGPVSIGICGALSTLLSARTIIGLAGAVPLLIIIIVLSVDSVLRVVRARRSGGG